jgi:catechol 2,3-dioxygenase-like lactoylglutathione lyase family enzyme
MEAAPGAAGATATARPPSSRQRRLDVRAGRGAAKVAAPGLLNLGAGVNTGRMGVVSNLFIACRLISGAAFCQQRRSFVAMIPATSIPNSGKVIGSSPPAVSVLDYHHLGLAVGDIERSCGFFEKLGFKKAPEWCVKPSVTVMRSSGGLYIQIFKADRPVEDERNLLMDFPEKKYPGHTHASFTVPSVSGARAFLEGQGIAISGERKPMGRLRAVFVRDPDRTTFEFEKNVGEDDELPGCSFPFHGSVDPSIHRHSIVESLIDAHPPDVRRLHAGDDRQQAPHGPRRHPRARTHGAPRVVRGEARLRQRGERIAA